MNKNNLLKRLSFEYLVKEIPLINQRPVRSKQVKPQDVIKVDSQPKTLSEFQEDHVYAEELEQKLAELK
jgi:hypothetical protein